MNGFEHHLQDQFKIWSVCWNLGHLFTQLFDSGCIFEGAIIVLKCWALQEFLHASVIS